MMGTIKGLAILSRFEYLETSYGQDVFQKFIKEISTIEENYEKQPVVAANNYPESTLAKIDMIIEKEYFKSGLQEFFQLGEWNAEYLIPKYFNIYLDEKNPFEFVEQYGRLRVYLLGAGEMMVKKENAKSISIIIDYGQIIPKSVCLSEQGFISKGLEMCGFGKVKVVEKRCASSEKDFVCEYNLNRG